MVSATITFLWLMVCLFVLIDSMQRIDLYSYIWKDAKLLDAAWDLLLLGGLTNFLLLGIC